MSRYRCRNQPAYLSEPFARPEIPFFKLAVRLRTSGASKNPKITLRFSRASKLSVTLVLLGVGSLRFDDFF